jgi:hypothetical protein
MAVKTLSGMGPKYGQAAHLTAFDIASHYGCSATIVKANRDTQKTRSSSKRKLSESSNVMEQKTN